MARSLHRQQQPSQRWRIPMRRLVGCVLLALGLVAGWLWVTTPLPDQAHLRSQAARGDTRILDRAGRVLATLPDPLGATRMPVSAERIPLALRQATVAVEDASFYQNSGVDLRGIARAAWQNLQYGGVVAGGSTITQQLARTMLLDPALAQQQSLERKLREATLALKLTTLLPKDEILTLYLNQTYYGGTAYGVEAAAWRVFGKPVHELDLAESALLAGLPQAPSRYDPLADGGVSAQQRQQQVLAAMVRAGFLTQTQADQAAAEPLQYTQGSCQPGMCVQLAPHAVGYVLAVLAEQLGPEMLARGGLTITTTLDLGLQQDAERALRRQVELLNQPRAGQPGHHVRNGAVVVLDPHDGAILAMVGSPDYANRAIQGQVNATTARRQPGSALKPLTYAAAFEHGMTPASIVLDVPTSFSTREGQPYRPQNYDRTFHGPLSLREALATSSNVAAVRVLDSVGLPALLDLAERLGVRSLGRDPSRYGLALTLGGGEVSLLELSGAYAAFANAGQQTDPYIVADVRDADGQAVALPARSAPRLVVSPQVAFLISDILADPYARMRVFGDGLTLDRPAAVKTGTSTDWRDNWTVGYTPDRVVGVWIGNADGEPMQSISGVSGAGPVWRAVMRSAHAGTPAHPFTRPAGLVERTVCVASGLLPDSRCPTTRSELFITGTEPTESRPTQIELAIDPFRACLAAPGYPAERTVTRLFPLLPAEAEPWALAAGIALAPHTPCGPDDRPGQVQTIGLEPPGQHGRPSIVAPAAGARFAISSAIPAERQQLEIVAYADRSYQQITLLVDGISLAQFAGPPYRSFWGLRPGRHTIMVEARDQQGRVIQGDPVEIMVE